MRNLRLGRSASSGFVTSRLRSCHQPGAILARLGQLPLAIVLAVIAFGSPEAVLARSGGAPNGHSGEALPGEGLCTHCHTGSAPNTGSGSIELLINDAQATEYVYNPGEKVPILVRATDSSAARFGFQFTARVGNGCEQGGTLTAGTSMRLRSAQGEGDCAGTAGEVQWVTHSRPQSGSSAEFRFDWTAPEPDSGPVTFALAVVAADGNSSATGDQVYSLLAQLEEQTVAPLGPPQISEEKGVVLGDFHTMTGRGVPGALATVRGADFVDAPNEEWLGFDPETRYPSILGGACVKVNDNAVPLKSVSPDRIDFQIPVNATAGPVRVRVFRNCGESTEIGSNEATFEIVAVQPAFLWFAANPPAIGGRHSDGAPIGPKGLLPGIDTSPSVPEEIVSLYGTGFGPVNPALATGEVAREDRTLASTNYQVLIDGTAVPLADVLYIGAAPGFLGANRLDVRLPTDIEAGLRTITLKVNDVATPPGPALIVASPPTEVQVPACMANQALLPGRTCRVETLGTSIDFHVEANGSKLCASVPLRNQKSCGAMKLDLPQFGYQAIKNATGGWAITQID